jgi:hypothetical protein
MMGKRLIVRAGIATFGAMASVAIFAIVTETASAAVLAQAAKSSVLEHGAQLGTVTSMEAVHTTVGEAEAALDPSYIVSGESSPGGTTLVVLHGSFVDDAAKVRAGEAAPRGSVAAYYVDGSGRINGTYVGSHSPTLSALGVVEYTTMSATASIARHQRFVHRRLNPQPKAHTALWGNRCGQEGTEHCYGVANWQMSGSEEVLGAIEEVNVSAMNVPEYGSWAFVDDEMWVSLGSGSNGQHWMETGIENYEPYSCCQLWWFRAYKNNLGYYELPRSEEWEMPYNTWANFGVETIGGGGWCWYIGVNWEVQDGCRANFPTTSKHLEDGMEVASNSEPSNAAKIVVSAEHLNGKFYTWNKATNEAKRYNGEYTEHVCVSQFQPYPGNINVGTC